MYQTIELNDRVGVRVVKGEGLRFGAQIRERRTIRQIGVYEVLAEALDTRTAKRLISATGILAAVLGVGLTCYGIVIKARAEELLKDLMALKVGESTEVDAERFAQRHHKLFTSHRCDDDGCKTSFEIRNAWLSALRLEPDAGFEANLSVHNGIVTRIGAVLVRSMPIYPTFLGSAGMVDEYAEFPPRRDSRPRQVRDRHYAFPTPVGKPYLSVELDSHASSMERAHAFGFSFRCLVKPGWGCDLPCDYLPSAWQDWKARIQDSFSLDFFETACPHNARCPVDLR